MKEIWKDIKGYEGSYQVSNLGNIRNLNFHREGKTLLLKPTINNRGYKRVWLYKNSKNEAYLVHRLVAIAFIPNPNNYTVINHKDENPSNNCVDNLEWCTQHYNMNYGSVKEKISKAKKGKSSHNNKPILQFDLQGNFIKRWESASEAKKTLNIPGANIGRCCTGERKSASGFIWKHEFC